ncbi:MAG: methyltransferase domain-containing protein, partial [Planctomycetota bacterium]
MGRDDIYALRRDQVGRFEFDDQVADVFPDMISRSVPGYTSILSVVEQLAVRFVKDKTHVYDLGCSLGAATHLIHRHAPRETTIFAIDNSEAMVRRLRASFEFEGSTESAEVRTELADICEFPLSNASFIVL